MVNGGPVPEESLSPGPIRSGRALHSHVAGEPHCLQELHDAALYDWLMGIRTNPDFLHGVSGTLAGKWQFNIWSNAKKGVPRLVRQQCARRDCCGQRRGRLQKCKSPLLFLFEAWMLEEYAVRAKYGVKDA